MDSIAKKKNNAIFLVSFQVPGTPGSILLTKKMFSIRGKIRKVEATIEKFDFTSHGGMNAHRNKLTDLGDKTKVFAIHGEEKNCKQLVSWASKKLKLKAVAPKTGEVYRI
jgi:putative mRNA 3-end processing factor